MLKLIYFNWSWTFVALLLCKSCAELRIINGSHQRQLVALRFWAARCWPQSATSCAQHLTLATHSPPLTHSLSLSFTLLYIYTIYFALQNNQIGKLQRLLVFLARLLQPQKLVLVIVAVNYHIFFSFFFFFLLFFLGFLFSLFICYFCLYPVSRASAKWKGIWAALGAERYGKPMESLRKAIYIDICRYECRKSKPELRYFKVQLSIYIAVTPHWCSLRHS